MALVESFVLREPEERNLAQFYEDDDFGGQVDNWWAPTTTCLFSLCRTAGFARVELANRHDYGAALTCYRKWREEPWWTSSTTLRLLLSEYAKYVAAEVRVRLAAIVPDAADQPTGSLRAPIDRTRQVLDIVKKRNKE